MNKQLLNTQSFKAKEKGINYQSNNKENLKQDELSPVIDTDIDPSEGVVTTKAWKKNNSGIEISHINSGLYPSKNEPPKAPTSDDVHEGMKYISEHTD